MTWIWSLSLRSHSWSVTELGGNPGMPLLKPAYTISASALVPGGSAGYSCCGEGGSGVQKQSPEAQRCTEKGQSSSTLPEDLGVPAPVCT